jgi:hypothetical protein
MQTSNFEKEFIKQLTQGNNMENNNQLKFNAGIVARLADVDATFQSFKAQGEMISKFIETVGERLQYMENKIEEVIEESKELERPDMTRSEIFTVNHYLKKWPHHMNFAAIIEALEDDNGKEFSFHDDRSHAYSCEALAEEMETMSTELYYFFGSDDD